MKESRVTRHDQHVDLYAYLRTNPTLADMLDLVGYLEHDELLELQAVIRRRLAEIDLPAGQLVGVITEGETNVSPWRIVRPTSPASGAVVDVVTAGSFPTLCLTEQAWEQGHRIDGDGERLHVAVNGSHGYELRPLEPDDREVLPAA